VLFHFNKYITFNIPRGVAHITFQILFVISDAILAKTLLPIAYLYPFPLDIGLRVYCILFFCHFWVKIALPVSVLKFSTPADLYLRFPYLHFQSPLFVIEFLKNGVWYGKSYYRQLIGKHTLAFDWCHFWWPWSTFECHFSLGCHFHVHFSYPWHAFASHGLPAIAELLVWRRYLTFVVRNMYFIWKKCLQKSI